MHLYHISTFIENKLKEIYDYEDKVSIETNENLKLKYKFMIEFNKKIFSLLRRCVINFIAMPFKNAPGSEIVKLLGEISDNFLNATFYSKNKKSRNSLISNVLNSVKNFEDDNIRNLSIIFYDNSKINILNKNKTISME